VDQGAFLELHGSETSEQTTESVFARDMLLVCPCLRRCWRRPVARPIRQAVRRSR
jgi:hypothetical protein